MDFAISYSILELALSFPPMTITTSFLLARFLTSFWRSSVDAHIVLIKSKFFEIFLQISDYFFEFLDILGCLGNEAVFFGFIKLYFLRLFQTADYFGFFPDHSKILFTSLWFLSPKIRT